MLHVSQLLEPATVGMADKFAHNAEAVFTQMRASEPLPGHDPVRLPGDGKQAAVDQRMKNGLNINSALFRDLNALASEYRIDTLTR